jgi:2-polyprenyl-3-methyl-5-hydroxy-6-metoxy-1,4-benzoquinol methylase
VIERQHPEGPRYSRVQASVAPTLNRRLTLTGVATVDELLERWRAELAAWAVPEQIAAAVTESPWVLPRQVFARRADRLGRFPGGPSYQRAAEALAPRGTLLDVGCGAGAACLPLAPLATGITGVDADAGMLALLTERAAAAGVPASTVAGRWPDVAGQVAPADVVTCHHVLYNVPDLGPFLAELTRHARHRVVVEITAVHPLASLNPLWLRFHGLARPDRPTAAEALRIVAEMGLNPGHTEWSRPAEADYASFGELVEVTRRRLCLPPDRSGEVGAALLDLGISRQRPCDLGSSGRDMVTIWWEGSA